MPDIISTTLADSPFLIDWYTWGVIIAFLFALGATGWIFADAQRRSVDSTLWKSVAAVAAVLTVPALLARIHAGFAADMQSSLATLAMLSMLGFLLAAGAAVAQYATANQPAYIDPPYPPGPWDDGEGGKTIPVSPPEPVVERSPRKTTFLGASRPLALAWLVIGDGQYQGERMDIRANGVTRVGGHPDPDVNDWIIDDDAVSGIHLSIRHENGLFTATDLDAMNGTQVNGEEIRGKGARPIKHGDRIRIGRTNLVFVTVAEEPEAQAAQTA